MTVSYGFYNSVGNDRTYNATHFSKLFRGIINDGVFSTVGTSLMVTSNAGMNVQVGIGRAWFKDTWIDNDSALIKSVEPAHISLPRIDAVIIEFDSSEGVRENAIKVVTGTPDSVPGAPSMTHTATLNQYPLAYLEIPANAQTIPQDKITNKVGTADCPFVTGALTVVTTDQILAGWEAEFTLWFDAVKGQLGTDPAGNLQNQINVLTKRNSIINGGMDVWQRATSAIVGAQAMDGGYKTADRWYTSADTGTSTTISRQTIINSDVNAPELMYCLRAQRNQGQAAGTSILSYVFESQDSVRFRGKQVVLSFYAKKGADYSPSSSNLHVNLVKGTGTDQQYGMLDVGSPLINSDVVLTANWQRFTLSATFPNTTNQIGIKFSAVNLGTAGANDWYDITGIQLEEGTLVTAFEKTSIAETLSLCQRYYYSFPNPSSGSNLRFIGSGQVVAAHAAHIMLKMPVTMRKIPQVGSTNNSDFYLSLPNSSQYFSTSTDLVPVQSYSSGGGYNDYNSVLLFVISTSESTVLVPGNTTLMFRKTASTTVLISIDAEI